jgi:frataxin
LGQGKGTFVVNKQSPNRQLWLASPASGPFRYDPHRQQAAVVWRYKRDGHLLLDRLQQELSAACGAPCPSLHAE